MADPGRRSRAWGVLAVSLALMALVTALSSTTGHGASDPSAAALDRTSSGTRATVGSQAPRTSGPARSGSGRGRPASSAHTGTGHAGRAAPHQSGAVGAGGREPTGRAATTTLDAGSAASHITQMFVTSAGGTRLGPVTTDNPPTGGSSPPGGVAGAPAAPASSASGSPSGVGTSPSTTPTAASGGGASSSGVYTEHGAIEPPATSATFEVAAGGTVAATATWTGAAELELGISCRGGVSTARSGRSPLSLEVEETIGSGSCAVTLATMPGSRADVSFTLVIDSAP